MSTGRYDPLAQPAYHPGNEAVGGPSIAVQIAQILYRLDQIERRLSLIDRPTDPPGRTILDSWIGASIAAPVTLAPSGTYNQNLTLAQDTLVGADFDVSGGLIEFLIDGWFQVCVVVDIHDPTPGTVSLDGADGTVQFVLRGSAVGAGMLNWFNLNQVLFPFKPSNIVGQAGDNYQGFYTSPVFHLVGGPGFNLGLKVNVVNNGTPGSNINVASGAGSTGLVICRVT